MSSNPFVHFFFNGCFAGAQKRICELFQGQRRRQRDDPAFPLPSDGGQPFGDVGVARFDRNGEAQIAQGVFMSAVDQRIFGKGCKACQRAVHLLWRAFEQSSATGGEQGVTAKQQTLVIKGYVPQCMAGDLDDLEVTAQHADSVAILEGDVPRRDIFTGRAVDGSVCRFFELFDTADMVMMMVSDQNIAQYPFRMRREPGLDRRGISRIDDGTTPGVGVL